MRKPILITLALLILLVGCSRGPKLADCYTGNGVTSSGEHVTASLRLHVANANDVFGTYVVGATKDQGVQYSVDGTLHGSRFDGTFTALGQALHVTGTVRHASVHLDDPSHSFAITAFTAGC